MDDHTLHAMVSNLTFDHLLTLKTVVEKGTFKGAAEALAMSQPAVSQRIQHMERALGVPLFVRHPGSPARLTPFGERMLSFSDRAMNDLKQLRHDLAEVHPSTETPALTVAAGPSYIKYRLLSIFQSFNQCYPDVQLQVRHSPTPEDILLAVMSGNADLAIYAGAVPSSKVHVLAVVPDRLVLVASRTNSIFEVPPTELPEALEKLDLAVASEGANSRQVFDAWASQKGLSLRLKVEVDNLDTLKEAALQDIAVAFVPVFAVEQELASGTLKSIEALGLPVDRRISVLASPRYSPSSDAANLFGDYLIKALATQCGA